VNNMLQDLLLYKQWANAITFEDALTLTDRATQHCGPTKWQSIAYTLSHSWTVDDIFRHHVMGKPHSYTQRNLDHRLTVHELQTQQVEMDNWWLNFVISCNPDEINKSIRFNFVGGGEGHMSIAEIILHIVNHSTYHRGMVSAMLYDHGVSPRANDYPVYLRDAKMLAA
jgi:uncharacterized damage-inducible protein DinB